MNCMQRAQLLNVFLQELSGVNPQGCEVFSFKQPSAEELEHDFLWRTTRHLPDAGGIGIFNRSYYEEVLVVRVHPEILRNEGLPEKLHDEKNIWKERYRSIVDLEEHLHRNGSLLIKFFLHLSKNEQRKRFLERIDESYKNWKFSLSDVPAEVAACKHGEFHQFRRHSIVKTDRVRRPFVLPLGI